MRGHVVSMPLNSTESLESVVQSLPRRDLEKRVKLCILGNKSTWKIAKSIARRGPLSIKLEPMLLFLQWLKETRLAALAFGRALRDPKGEDHGYLTTFWAQNTPKSGPFKTENNAQTLPKQVQNNFEKVAKSTFLTPKWSKMTPQIGQNEQNFDPKSRFSKSFIDLLSSKYTQKWAF